MTRQAVEYQEGQLYIDYDNLAQSPVTRSYQLSDNTALLAYLFLRHFSQQRGIFVVQGLTEFETVTDGEYHLIQDWIEVALAELREPD